MCFDDFAWAALNTEARREKLPVEEFAKFAILYYLADKDSGRIARRPIRSGLLVEHDV